ncbi:hypothetical protein KAW50_03555 [candidate division WOR-3 bacterium]|nr:hypothetical protein [candidate division WOR-3 bacterium]
MPTKKIKKRETEKEAFTALPTDKIGEERLIAELEKYVDFQINRWGPVCVVNLEIFKHDLICILKGEDPDAGKITASHPSVSKEELDKQVKEREDASRNLSKEKKDEFSQPGPTQ